MCKGNSQSTTNQKPDPRAMRAYLNVFRRAERAAEEPYQAYDKELVANPTADMSRAYEAIRALQGTAQPAFSNASAMFTRAGQPITPKEFSQAEIDRYMDPYLNTVVDATAANIARENAIAQRRLQGNAISRGAFGGDRSGVAAAELERSQGLARNQTMAELMSKGYGQALGMFNTQQGVDLNAQQQNVANALAAGQQWYNFGQGQVQTGLGVANAQLQAGQLQQQQKQNELNAAYQQWQNRRAYPFQSIGWLGNLVAGVGNNTGGTSTTTQAPPSLLSGLVGLGTAGLGAISDRRMKTGVARVGRTDDGQPIYRFRYKGDPSGVAHMGLMAQEVEKKHPEAVREGVGGIKHVDYMKATGKAAGGGVAPVGMQPYASDYIGLDPFGTRKDDFILRVPGLALGGGVEDEPYSSGLSYVPKPKQIGDGGGWRIDAPRPKDPEGLMGLGVSTKELTDLGIAAKSAAPKIKGILGIGNKVTPNKPDDYIAPEGYGGIGRMARGGKAVPPRGVSRAAFSARSAADNPGNEWSANDGYPNPDLDRTGGASGYNNPFADNPHGGHYDDWGIGMADSGMNPTGHIPGGTLPSTVALGSNVQGLPGPPVGRTYGWNSQIASRYTGTGGPPGLPARQPAVAHARVTAPGYLGGTTALSGPMGGAYSGNFSDAGYGSVADPNNYGGFSGHGYGTHDYGIGAQAAGFAGGDNYGLSDFSGGSPSSNGPSSGGSSGGYSGAGTGGFGGADGFESRARGGRADGPRRNVVQMPTPAAPPPVSPLQLPVAGQQVIRDRRGSPVVLRQPAPGATTRSIGGLDGVGGWDPGGNPVDPGLGGDGSTSTPSDGGYIGDGVFGGDLRDDGGWADIGGWQNTGDYLRGTLPPDPNSMQGMNWDMMPDFSSQPMASRGWGAFGPNGLQPGAMGPAPNPHPLGYSYSPTPTSGGYDSYGGFSGSADAPGTAAGTGSFGSADGYDSRARGGGVASMAFARGGAKRVPPRGGVAAAASTRDRIGDAHDMYGGSEPPPSMSDANYHGLGPAGAAQLGMGSMYAAPPDYSTVYTGETFPGGALGPGQKYVTPDDLLGFNWPGFTAPTTTVKVAPPSAPVVQVKPGVVAGRPPGMPGAAPGAAPAGGSAPAGYSGNYSDAGYGSVADPNNYGGFAGHGYGTHDYGVGAQMTGFTGADNFGFTDFSGSEPGSNGPSSGGSSGGYSGAGSGGFGGADGYESRSRGGGVGRMGFAPGGGIPFPPGGEEAARIAAAKEAAAEEAADKAIIAKSIERGIAEGTLGPDGKMPKKSPEELNPVAERSVIRGGRRAIPVVEEPTPPKGVAAIARVAGEPVGVAAAAKPEPKGGIEGLAAKIKSTFTGEGEGFSPETRAALMAAGFGIMAGGSRNPFMNIGAGGLKGVEQYNVGVTQTQNTRRLDQAATQLAQDLMRIQNETKATDAEVNRINRVELAPFAKIGKDNTVEGVSAPYVGLPTDSVNAPVPPGGGKAGSPGSVAVEKGTETLEDLFKPPPQPSLNEKIVVPKLGAEGRNLFVPEFRQPAEEANKYVRDRVANDFASAQANAVQIEALDHALKQIPKSGPLGAGTTVDARIGIGQTILDAASVFGIDKSVTAGLAKDIGAHEDLRKMSRVFAAELARAGGQESLGALVSSLETVPTANLSTVGARRILEAMRAVQQRKIDKASFLAQWQANNPGHRLDMAEQAFDLRYPPAMYANRAMVKSIPPEAVAQLKADKRPQAARQFDEAFGKGASAAVRYFKQDE